MGGMPFPHPLLAVVSRVCWDRYLTDLNSLKINSDAEVGDIEKVSQAWMVHV